MLTISIFAMTQNIFKTNSVYYISDTLKGGEFDGLILYTHYKFLDDSKVYISIPKKEKPTINNTISLSLEKGYYGKVKIIKTNMVKIICNKGLFKRTREIFIVGEKEIKLVKFVYEGMLFFQWRKPKKDVPLTILK
jgi:hypothetical protein